jgi:ABC-2 type transport system permease protein
MFSRIWNLVWKEAIQFWRYKLILAFVLIFPVWNLTSVADMVSRGIMHIPTAVYDQDQSQASRDLVMMLQNSDVFDTEYYVGSMDDLAQKLEVGTAKVGLVIPRNFGGDLVDVRQTNVQVFLDGSETTTALIAQAYLEGLAYEYAGQALDEKPTGLAAMDYLVGVEARARVWFNEDMRREVFQLPAEMAGGIALLAILLPAVAIIKEREAGTLEQLFVSPIRSIELITGKGLLALIITFLVFVEMLALNVWHFQVPMRGSLVLLLVLTGYYISIEMGWGLLISAVARTQGQGFLGAFLIAVSEIILSGQILPVEYMPQAAQIASYLMPNRHYTAMVREIMLKGASLADLWPQVVVLGVLGVILYTLAVNRLRRGFE